jgi:hypothetical protein
MKFLKYFLMTVLVLSPVAALAQDVPSYATPDIDQQIKGRILSVNDAYNISVRDENGYVDNVELHQGTIINPTGLTLAPGMVVFINGFANGSEFDANQIDTPYTSYEGDWYYDGHPWNYYGDGFALGFFFGNVGWWGHGYHYYHPYYGFYHGGGYYHGGNSYHFNVHINNTRINSYHAPAYHGIFHRH